MCRLMHLPMFVCVRTCVYIHVYACMHAHHTPIKSKDVMCATIQLNEINPSQNRCLRCDLLRYRYGSAVRRSRDDEEATT